MAMCLAFTRKVKGDQNEGFRMFKAVHATVCKSNNSGTLHKHPYVILGQLSTCWRVTRVHFNKHARKVAPPY
jgi:hypothetical protein